MPNRIIKETICTSENLDNLTPEEEVFFYRLLVNCDDYGRADARPQILRAKCFPMKVDRISNSDIEKWLKALARENLIILYTVDGKPYLQFVTWDKHQQIRAKKSKFPAPDNNGKNLISNGINCNQEIANVPVIEIQSESESESYSESEAESKSEQLINCEQEINCEQGQSGEEQPFAAGAQSLSIVRRFEKDFDRALSPTEYEQIVSWQDKHPDDVIAEALRRAVIGGKFNLRYIDKILLNWEKNNLHTLREVLEFEERYERLKHAASNQATAGVSDPAKVIRFEQKRREETIRAACDYIRFQYGNDPPRAKAEEAAAGYSEELAAEILRRLYGGGG